MMGVLTAFMMVAMAAATMSPTTPQPSMDCPGEIKYDPSKMVTMSACAGCENGTITEIFFSNMTSAADCARRCDQQVAAHSFLYTSGGPHQDGCWCKVLTSTPTTCRPTTLSPSSITPSTFHPVTSTPTSLSPSTVSPTSFSPATGAPSGTPTTTSPTSLAPSSLSPSTFTPLTLEPTLTLAPSTSPSTCSPSSLSPSSLSPSSNSPTSCSPSSLSPSSLSPGSNSPTSCSPTSLSPSTFHPVTAAPSTLNPSDSPTSLAPSTLGPTSCSPSTQGPTSCGPTSLSPTSLSPVSNSPSETPTSFSPTSCSPTSLGPTSLSPSSCSPSSACPSTTPTSCNPTSLGPTSLSPSSQNPTSCSPSTLSPSSLSPSTFSPATTAPSEAPTSCSPSSACPSTTPTSCSPSSLAPSSLSPSSSSPSSAMPSETPTSCSPSSVCPSTTPTTCGPTSLSPSSLSPSTFSPESNMPTETPTTCQPTETPTTFSPETLAPSTTPTTCSPSSATPSTTPTTRGPTRSPVTRWPTYTRSPSLTPTSLSPSTTHPTLMPGSVQNPSFENDVVVDTGNGFDYVSSVDSWVVSTTVVMTIQSNSLWGSLNSSVGNQFLILQFTGSSAIQNVTHLSAGESYTLSWLAANRPPPYDAASGRVQVEGDSGVLGTWQDSPPSSGFQSYSLSFTLPTIISWAVITVNNTSPLGDRSVFFDDFNLIHVSQSPSTQSPTTQSPSTQSPSTQSPSTQSPSSLLPSTCPTVTVSPSLAPTITRSPSKVSMLSYSDGERDPNAFQWAWADIGDSGGEYEWRNGHGRRLLSTCECPYDTITSLSPSVTATVNYVTGVISDVRFCETGSPTTCNPTSLAPSSQCPSTCSPSSWGPTSVFPSTCSPSSEMPTSLSPTSLAPTTTSPSTCNPSSQSPTSIFPTMSPATTAPTTVCTPPQLEQAQIQDSGGGMVITLSAASNQAGMSPTNSSCFQILRPATIALLGTSPACTWSSTTLLRVTFGSAATIVAGNSVEIKQGVLSRPPATCNSTLDNGVISLLAPSNPVAVTSIVTTPASFGSCSNIELSAKDSKGNAGRNFVAFSWTLQSVSPNPMTIASNSFLTALQAFVISSSSSILNLNAALSMIQGASGGADTVFLRISLSATNWLSSTGNTTLEISILTSSEVPNVVIDGESTRQVTAGSQVVITTTYTPPNATQCNSTLISGGLKYTWTSTSGHDSLIDFPNAADLVIASGRLVAGITYAFELTNNFQLSPGSTTTSYVNISVASNPPVAKITSCNRLVSKTTEGMVTISGAQSYEPDNLTLGTSNLGLSWSCERQLSDETYVSPCYLFLTSAGDTLSFDTAQLNMTNGSAESGQSQLKASDEILYVFRLNVTHLITGLNDTSTCQIWVRNSPGGEITTESIIQGEQIAIEANTTGSSFTATRISGRFAYRSSGITYFWNCQLPDGSSCGLNLDSTSVVLSSRTSRVLILSKAGLSSGVDYQLFVEAKNADGTTSGVAFARVLVPPGPTSGTCESTPASGVQFSTNFLFSCSGWTGGTDITYQFQRNDKVLRAASTRSSFTTTIPNTGEILLTVTISNAEGGSTVTTLNVTVSKSTLSGAGLQALLQSQQEAANLAALSGDLSAMTAAFDNTLGLLSSSSDVTALGATLINLAIVGARNAPATSANEAMKANLFSSTLTAVLAAGGAISELTANATAQFLGQLITSLDANPDLDYTDSFGGSAATSIASILGTTATSGPELRAAVNSATDGLGKALAGTISAGQAPKTLSTTGLDLSVQKVEIDSGGSNLSVTHGEGSASTESVVFNPDELANVVTDPTFVFRSSGNFWGRPDNLAQWTDLVALSVLNSSLGEVEIQNLGSILISISQSNSSLEVPPLPSDACQFYDEVSLQWNSTGCTLANYSNGVFVCNCTHLTSFQVAGDEIVVNTLTTEDFRNLNFNNLARNPFTTFALLFVFLIWVLVSLLARWCRGEAMIPDEDDKDYAALERDFLLQWYFQLPLLARDGQFGPIIGQDPRTNESMRIGDRADSIRGAPRTNSAVPLDNTESFAGTGPRLARTKGLRRRVRSSRRNFLGRMFSRKKTIGLIEDERRTVYTCGCLCPRRETIEERDIRLEKMQKVRIVRRIKKALRRTGGREAEALLRESERRERRYLKKAQERIELGGAPEMTRRRVAALVEAAAKQRRWRRKEWQKRRDRLRGRMFRLWVQFIKMTHMWLSIFVHRKLDPYSSQWRANVLVMSLLLILMVNGVFYAGADDDDSFGNIMFVGVLSAMLVAMAAFILIYLAKRVGYLEWEVHICRIRNRLCQPLSNFDAPKPEYVSSPAINARNQGPVNQDKLFPLDDKNLAELKNASVGNTLISSGMPNSHHQSALIGNSIGGTPVMSPEDSPRQIMPKALAVHNRLDTNGDVKLMPLKIQAIEKKESDTGDEKMDSPAPQQKAKKTALIKRAIYVNPNDKSLRPMDQSEWMMDIAEHGAKGNRDDAYSVENRLKKLQRYKIAAWGFFAIASVGSAFIVLVLGLKFDLQDEVGEGSGVEVQRSASFAWLSSVIVSELLRQAVVSPLAVLTQTVLLFYAMEFCAASVLDHLIDSDSVVATKAFDVFKRAVTGFELKHVSFLRLKELIHHARKKVIDKIVNYEMRKHRRNGTIPNTAGTAMGLEAGGGDSLLSIDEKEFSNSSESDSSDIAKEPAIPPLLSEFGRTLSEDDMIRPLLSGIRAEGSVASQPDGPPNIVGMTHTRTLSGMGTRPRGASSRAQLFRDKKDNKESSEGKHTNRPSIQPSQSTGLLSRNSNTNDKTDKLPQRKSMPSKSAEALSYIPSKNSPPNLSSTNSKPTSNPKVDSAFPKILTLNDVPRSPEPNNKNDNVNNLTLERPTEGTGNEGECKKLSTGRVGSPREGATTPLERKIRGFSNFTTPERQKVNELDKDQNSPDVKSRESDKGVSTSTSVITTKPVLPSPSLLSGGSNKSSNAQPAFIASSALSSLQPQQLLPLPSLIPASATKRPSLVITVPEGMTEDTDRPAAATSDGGLKTSTSDITLPLPELLMGRSVSDPPPMGIEPLQIDDEYKGSNSSVRSSARAAMIAAAFNVEETPRCTEKNSSQGSSAGTIDVIARSMRDSREAKKEIKPAENIATKSSVPRIFSDPPKTHR
ncbi:hypothetical protein AAMO2058_001325100 [Amorphochlora amoebiformis]